MGNSKSLPSGTNQIIGGNSKAFPSAPSQIAVGTSKSLPLGTSQMSKNKKNKENLNPIPSKTDQIAKSQEEIIIMSSLNEMVQHFVERNAIIWHDPNVHSHENAAYITELKKICDAQVFTDWKAASEYLKKQSRLAYCQVITSGSNGELFVKEISILPFISSIYVFCNRIDYHKTWTSRYSKIVGLDNNFWRLLDKIKKSMINWQRAGSSRRVSLPNFGPIFNETDLSEMNYLHFYLKGLTNFKNRHQAKKDFLTLAKALYGKDKNIEEFEKNYNQYDMKAILNWYSRECFFNKLTNNCLRIAKLDSVQYCRFALKDLETAIKDKYRQHSHNFSGMLYRGGYLSDNEWTRLQENINREIEMHGFLSTTKQKKVALNFCWGDVDKMAMITIIVPNFLYQGEQGFAELNEDSDFQGEDEVLFNVRSRFTVLEASLEEIEGIKMRHLVLLYDAQAMRKFTTDYDPSFEVQINITRTTECQACKRKIGTAHEPIIAVNICKEDEYFCKECMQQPSMTKRLVLLCLSPAAHGLLHLSSEKNQMINLTIEGTVMQQLQDSLDIPFYGEKCAICKETRLSNCYRCLDCKNAKIVYCTKCFQDQNKNACLGKGHMIILEGSPFRFWCDKLSKSELNHLKYQKEEIEGTNDLFQQANIFQKTHKYENCIEYYQKYLEKNGNSKNNETATCYNNLGGAYLALGEYEKTIECFSKSLEIRRAMFGDKHPDTAASYSNLGEAYRDLGEYQKAIEYHFKALEIRKIVFQVNHPRTADSYSALGEIYRSLGEYQKAIEYHSEALKIKTTVFGENHPDTVNCYDSLGNTYVQLGKYRIAINHCSKSLEIYKATLGDNHPDTANSYCNLGNAYYLSGEYLKAIECHSKALEIRKTVFGENHPSPVDSYNNLGAVYLELGEYQKAIEYYSKASTVFQDKHPKAATSYNNLGVAYVNLGEYQKAVEYQLKALEINKSIFGNSHPTTASSYNNLGEAYMNLGENHTAIKCFSKSLEVCRVVLGENHFITAVSYNDLGAAYFLLGEYQKAIEYHSKALEIRKAVLGDKSRSTADSYNNLGGVYSRVGKDQKAIEYYSKALEIRNAVFQVNHPRTSDCYNNLGEAYRSLGEFQKAIECHSKALEIRKTVLGESHPHTATSYSNFGALYLQLAEYLKAIEYHSKALEIRKAAFQGNHSSIACSYNNLGEAYQCLGEYLRAIKHFSKSLEIYKATLGDNHPDTANPYNNLGNTYFLLGEYLKAIEYLSKALKIRKTVFGDIHLDTVATCDSLELANQMYEKFLNSS